MDTPVSLIVIIFLLATNVFFVAAEVALGKARHVRIRKLAEDGNTSAQLTLKIQDNLEAYLVACQLGITMASLGLGWVGAPAVTALLEPILSVLRIPSEMIHPAVFVVGFLIFSSLHIVIGEQLPKTIAIQKAEPVSLWIAYPLRLSYLAAWPLIFLLNKTTGKLLNFLGTNQSRHADIYTYKELQGLLKSSSEHGHIPESKATMLNNLFEFYERQVVSVMIPRSAVTTLDISKSAEENIALINNNRHSRLPVIDSKRGDTIVGLILVKDVQQALIMNGDSSWDELTNLCRPPPYCSRIPTRTQTLRNYALTPGTHGSGRGRVW